VAAPKPSPETTLRIQRLFTAPREKVFQAWIEPDKMSKWLGRVTPQHSTRILEADLRIGGRYRLEIRSPDGALHLLSGAYREVMPPEKLAFTWSWEGTPDFGETLVTVEFHPRGTFTEVVLTHEFFPNKEACNNHTKGWHGCFDTLAKSLEA
jgi:uncharacterized protein YndB with AHSA1/START domain